MKYPMSHRISIPKPYIRSEATDISKTIATEIRRLKEAASKPVRTRVTPLRAKQGAVK